MLSNNIGMIGDDYLQEKKFQVMIDQSIQKLAVELESANEKISRLQGEINELKIALSSQRFEKPAGNIQSSSQNAAKPERKRTEMPGRPDPADYAEGEITIERFFSFAKKR